MSGRKVAVMWICTAVVLSAVTLSGAVGLGVSAAGANAEIQVVNAELEEDTVVEGEDVDITATVENVGNQSGTFEAELETEEDGVIDTEDVEIDAGETETVEFTETFDEGTYGISVSGEFAGELVVTKPAEFEVEDVELSSDEIVAGESVDVTAEIENDGDADGTFTAELQVDGDVVDTRSVDVDADESETVSFTRTFEQAGTYDIAVNGESADELEVTEPASPEFRVEDVELSSDEIVAGESVDVTAEIENDGDADGTFTAELQVDGDIVDTRSVDVDADESETVDFTQRFDETGTYDIAVNGESAGELVVTEPATADISVREATLSESEIDRGKSVTITATVENAGDADGEFTAELQVDGDIVDTERVDVDADESETVSFTRTFEQAGTYEIGVSGESAGELVVTEPATADISVRKATLSDSEIDRGESTTITASVENTGEADGTFTAELQVDGDVVDDRSVDVEDGKTNSVDFTRTFEDAGTYAIAVSGESAGKLTVSAPDPAAFEVSNARLDDDTVLAGERAVLSAEVTNTGEQDGTFTAEFRVTDGNGNTQTVDSQDVTLAGGASERVELSEPFDSSGEYDVQFNQMNAGTLTIESPADPTVTDARLEDPVVSDGEEAAVTATIENTGDREGDLSVAVAADGAVKDTEEVTVGPGESTTERLTYTATDYGEYEITVNGVSAGTLTVVQPATFRTTNPNLDSETVLEGEPIEVTATIVNVGSEQGTHSATLFVDGESVDSKELDLDPGESDAVTFNRTFGEADEYAIAINDASAGTLSVLRPADVSIRSATLSEEEIVSGESAEVTVELENDGDVDGEFTTRLRNGNDTLDTVTRAVGPSATETVSFNRTFETTGDYDLAVNDDPVGTLAVLEPADVSLDDASVDTDSVAVNESVQLTVELRNGGEATGQRVVDIALGDGTTLQRTAAVPENGTALTVSHAYEDTGEYTVSVDETTVENVTVVEEQENSGSGGTGSPGSSGSSGSTTTGGGVPTVVRSESDEAVTISVDGMNGERYDFSVGLAGPSATQSEVSLSTLAIEPAGGQEAFEATVGQPTADPGDRAAVTHGTVLGYVNIDSTLDATDTSAATLEFDLKQEAIPEGLGPDDVAVMRYADNEWTTTNVTHEINGDDHRVTLPHATPVAIVALEPGSVDVVDAELPADQVRVGYETMLRATIRNPGDRPANRTLAVTMDDGPVAEREVSLEPNETATIQIEFAPSGSGTVSLDGSEVGSIAVFGEDTGGTSTGSQTEESAPGFGPVVALLALLVATLAARARRR